MTDEAAAAVIVVVGIGLIIVVLRFKLLGGSARAPVAAKLVPFFLPRTADDGAPRLESGVEAVPCGTCCSCRTSLNFPYCSSSRIRVQQLSRSRRRHQSRFELDDTYNYFRGLEFQVR